MESDSLEISTNLYLLSYLSFPINSLTGGSTTGERNIIMNKWKQISNNNCNLNLYLLYIVYSCSRCSQKVACSGFSFPNYPISLVLSSLPSTPHPPSYQSFLGMVCVWAGRWVDRWRERGKFNPVGLSRVKS